jgi:very-short-patch-repair endonuclease
MTQPHMTQLARLLRKQMTRQEEALWLALRRHAVLETKFRRQHPIGPFIVDFFAPSHRLAVELDGSVHDRILDVHRDRWLEDFGIRTLRFDNVMVDQHLPDVLAEISRSLQSPLRKGEGWERG